MRLLRLELQDVKRYIGQARVVTFDPRATVLHGHNEAGKSTIFEAVRRVLFDRSRTQARWVERMVPYGSRALPWVRLDFEHAGRTLRIEKHFGSKGDAALFERRCGVEWAKLAANEEAEELLLAALGASASGARDGAPPENWGAFQWLLVPQDQRALPDAKSDATRHLGLEAAGVSDGFENVRQQIMSEYSGTFTTTGREAAHSELAAIRKRISDLEQQHEEAAGEVERLAELRRRYDEKCDELPRAMEDAASAKQEWEAAQSEAEGLAAAEGERQAAIEAGHAADERARSASAVLRERRRLEKAAAEAEEKRQAAIAEDIKATEEFEQTTRRWTEAREEAGRRGEAAARLRKTSLDAERCQNARSARRELDTLREVHRRAVAADGRATAARAAIGEEPPKPAVISRALDVEGAAREKRAASRGAALSVTVEGSPGLRVLVDGRELVEAEATALDAVVLETKKGRITVRGDTAHAQRLADEATDLEQQLVNLLSPFAVKNIEELRGLREERLKKKAEHDAASNEREAVDQRSTIELAAEIDRLAVRAEDADRARGGARTDEAGVASVAAGGEAAHDAMSDDELRAAVRRLEGDARAAEKAFEAARKEREKQNESYDRCRKAQQEAGSSLAGADVAAARSSTDLDRHRDSYGSTDKCRDDDDVARRALVGATLRRDAATEAAQRIARDADTRRVSTRRKYVRLDEATRTLEAAIREMAETLDRESVRGVYSRLGQLERTLEAERDRRKRLQLTANAVSHLRTIMDDVRREVVRRVVAPIKNDVDSLIAAATLGRYSSIASLDDALRPGTLEGSARCEFEDGSQGLRELVATLLRLTVATHLSKDEPQTVILDDPCVHVSRERTARVVEILNQRTGGGRIQVVVLTHRGNEFLGLIGADVDVAAL